MHGNEVSSMELKTALKNLPFICEMTEKQVEAVKVLGTLGENVLEIGGVMPEKMIGDGSYVFVGNPSIPQVYNSTIDNCTLAVAGMLAEKDKKIAELEDDIAKLNTYGDTYKKDYHDMKDERDELLKKIPDLETLLDGASIAVEVFNATTPAQVEWKENWLRKFREGK